MNRLSARACATLMVLLVATAACANNRSRSGGAGASASPGANGPGAPGASGSPGTAGGPGAGGAGGGGASPGTSPGGPGSAPAIPGAGGSRTPAPRTAVPAPRRAMAVSVSVEPSCVESTGTATVRVHTDPGSFVNVQVYWAGNKPGPSTTKRADSNGDFAWTFVVTIGTPTGEAHADASASSFDGGEGNAKATFSVVGEGQRCP